MEQERRIGRAGMLPWVAAALAALAAFLLRRVLAALLWQLLAGYTLMALALPLCRLLEKRFSATAAASLSFAGLAVLGLGVLLLLIPPLIRQLRQVSDMFPAVMAWGQGVWSRAQALLREKGIDLTPVRDGLFAQLTQRAGAVMSGAAQAAGQAVQSVSKLFLAPLLAFYLLRDRRRIASSLTLLLPVRHRARAVRAAREMRRETANFLRGQLLLSAFVGVLTAVGLLLTGTQGWLVLGLLMGVMELVPYIGPVIAGIPAVLLALQGGMARALWALGVLVAVQQLEGGLLSPRLLSGATKLHPVWVLLAISAGGMLGGAMGMLLALPVVVSLRGALRGLRE